MLIVVGVLCCISYSFVYHLNVSFSESITSVGGRDSWCFCNRLLAIMCFCSVPFLLNAWDILHYFTAVLPWPFIYLFYRFIGRFTGLFVLIVFCLFVIFIYFPFWF